ncbi:MAG: ABC-2 transporter permease [Lachnospiraceae bacterium]|nr:ABC-2 transporter permease [Lachnospiraceae bacterium]
MRGLIKNEFLTLRRVILLYAGVLLFYYFLGAFGMKMSGVQIFSVFFATMLVISSFSYEEKSGWSVYVNVLPVSRTQIVMCKYLFSMICMITASAFGFLIQCGMNLQKGVSMFQDSWAAGAAAIIACLFLSVVLPVLFQVGADKSRVILVLLFMIPFAVALLIEKSGIKFHISLEQLPSLLPAAGLGTVALLLLSCVVSIEIYKRKEF